MVLGGWVISLDHIQTIKSHVRPPFRAMHVHCILMHTYAYTPPAHQPVMPTAVPRLPLLSHVLITFLGGHVPRGTAWGGVKMAVEAVRGGSNHPLGRPEGTW